MKVIDTHLDLTFDLVRRSNEFDNELLKREYHKNFVDGNVDCVVSAIYIDDQYIGDKAYERALEHIEILEKEVSNNSEFEICKNHHDLKRVNEENHIGFFISLEGVEPIEDKIERIDEFFNRGVRLMGLTWSRDNLVASGSRFDDNSAEDQGLTEFGLRALKRIEELDIVLDVSHLNEQGFWEVIEHYNKPIIASHSNCRAIRDITRNLSDDQIRAIRDKNGFIGINGSSIILSDDDGDVNENRYVDHIDHVVKIAGIENVGFGFDLCNKIMCYVEADYLSMMGRIPFDCIGGHQEISKIIEELRSRGYTESEIEKITYGNFLRIIEQVLN
jgi:membrane dipeptidase